MSASNCENGQAYILKDRAMPLAGYPHMREADGFIFVSGISSRRADNTVEGVDEVDGQIRTDTGAQTRGVIENLKTLLAAAGAGLEHVVSLTCYLVDMGDYAAFNQAYNSYFDAETGPVRTTIGVASLPGPHLKIEMTAIARSPRRFANVPIALSAALQPLADRLWDAARSRTPCAPLSDDASLTVEDAYAIQRANLARGGDRRIGHKVGLTSAAVQKWLGVDEPDFGGLTAGMAIGDGARAPIDRLLQPRVEGEIAFVLDRDLTGPVTAVDVLSATRYVVPSIEIIDSRVADWKIKLVDTVADNASSAMFVLGTSMRPLDGLDLRLIGMTLRKNGEGVSSGAGAACLDNPVNAVAWLANKLTSLGETLRAGDVILSGALGPVVGVAAGDLVEVEISGLGRASVRF